jgi:hypothetical protein
MTDDDVRGFADERRRLLVELDRERNQFIRNVETCRIRDIERPFLGDWTLKDIVAHVASWDAAVVSAFRGLREGKHPTILDMDEGEVDDWNADHVERSRNLNFWSVLEQLHGGRERLMEEIALLDDEETGAEGTIHHRLLRAVIDHDRIHWHEIAAKLAGMAGARADTPASIPADAAATS